MEFSIWSLSSADRREGYCRYRLNNKFLQSIVFQLYN